MLNQIDYSKAERFWLIFLGVFGLVVVNGTFAYGLFVQRNALTEALSNPLSAAFIVKALVLVGVFAYLFISALGSAPTQLGLVRHIVADRQYGIRHSYRLAVPEKKHRNSLTLF